MLRSMVIVFAASIIAVGCGSSSAWAMEESLSIGEVMGRDLGNAMKAAGEYSALKADFNAGIAKVRREFAATYPGKPGHEKAENELADALMAKDYHFLSLYLATGTVGAAAQNVGGLNLLTGGSLDGGIPISAWDEFGNWVAAVRHHLGGKPEELLLVTNPSKILPAVDSSMSAYQKYKVVRDKAELKGMGIAPEIARIEQSESWAERWYEGCLSLHARTQNEEYRAFQRAASAEYCGCITSALGDIKKELPESVAKAYAQNPISGRFAAMDGEHQFVLDKTSPCDSKWEDPYDVVRRFKEESGCCHWTEDGCQKENRCSFN